MKPRFLVPLCLGLLARLPLPAQDAAPTSPPPPLDPTPGEPVLRTPAQLDELLGPIALYPDSLIALILPASTSSTDIVLAARYLEKGGDPATVDQQDWDASVEALAHFPQVVRWLDENLSWTVAVGEAFTAQPTEVMQSIQRLRAAAREAGTLVDTPQQKIVVEAERILIVPAQPDVIYVPVYDPTIVYVRHPGVRFTEPLFFFGSGFRTGWWLSYDCDWVSWQIWWAHPRHYRHVHRDWRQPRFPRHHDFVDNPDRRPWQPRPPLRRIDHDHRDRDHRSRPPAVVRPSPFDETRYRDRRHQRTDAVDDPPQDHEQQPTPSPRPEERRRRTPRPVAEPGGPAPSAADDAAPVAEDTIQPPANPPQAGPPSRHRGGRTRQGASDPSDTPPPPLSRRSPPPTGTPPADDPPSPPRSRRSPPSATPPPAVTPPAGDPPSPPRRRSTTTPPSRTSPPPAAQPPAWEPPPRSAPADRPPRVDRPPASRPDSPPPPPPPPARADPPPAQPQPRHQPPASNDDRRPGTSPQEN